MAKIRFIKFLYYMSLIVVSALAGAWTGGYISHSAGAEGSASGFFSSGSSLFAARSAEQRAQDQQKGYYPVHSSREIYNTPSGDFLVAIIAQKRHDWQTAGNMYSRLLSYDSANPALLQKVMILSLGSGEYDQALRAARDMRLREKTDQAMASVMIALDHLRDQKYEKALEILDSAEDDAQIRIIKPIIRAWAAAGSGRLEVGTLLENPLYIYDAVAIANYLDRQGEFESLLTKALGQNGIVSYDLERIGDLFARKSLREEATLLYEAALKQNERHTDRLRRKITALESGQNISERNYIVTGARNIQAGLSQSLFDLAMVLFRQNADTLSRIYASMALFLNPEFMDARLLMAHIMTYKGQLDQALDQYHSVPPSSASYIKAQQKAAELLEEAGHVEKALSVLRELYEKESDLKIRLTIANIYRRQEEYNKALEIYNEIFNTLEDKELDKEASDEGKIRAWNLHYLRGMTHERLKHYEKSERDLSAALEHNPSNPYILNYLGYSLADRGEDLDRALDYIQQAVRLAPNDGYITDSLGWVLYRMGNVEQAVPYLEKAVELLPYDAIVNDHLGDAYWQVGRKAEARFQWRRALNHTEDSDLVANIEKKMQEGLGALTKIRAAQSSVE